MFHSEINLYHIYLDAALETNETQLLYYIYIYTYLYGFILNINGLYT